MRFGYWLPGWMGPRIHMFDSRQNAAAQNSTMDPASMQPWRLTGMVICSELNRGEKE
jgi:hypothetical protein